MNIDELEKLARAALDTKGKNLPYRVLENRKFKAAANPSDILELIERVRKLEFALNHIASWGGVSAGLKTFKDVRWYAKYNANYTGENNE